jgi:hypothetical protein
MYPYQYKKILNILKNEQSFDLVRLVELFKYIDIEIDDKDYCDIEITKIEVDVEVARMDYNEARNIVSKSIIHYGFIEIDDDIYDSIDDCADILIDLDEIEKLASCNSPNDVWWMYIWSYRNHVKDHMVNIEKQVEMIVKSTQQGTELI